MSAKLQTSDSPSLAWNFQTARIGRHVPTTSRPSRAAKQRVSQDDTVLQPTPEKQTFTGQRPTCALCLGCVRCAKDPNATCALCRNCTMCIAASQQSAGAGTSCHSACSSRLG